MADVELPLSRTYMETGKQVSKLAFRVPRWSDFIDLGDIEEWQPLDVPGEGDGRMILVKHQDVVARYAERCLKEPNTAADLVVLDLVDALAVHRVIRDFFVQARSSSSPPTASSGDTAKDSTKSGD